LFNLAALLQAPKLPMIAAREKARRKRWQSRFFRAAWQVAVAMHQPSHRLPGAIYHVLQRHRRSLERNFAPSPPDADAGDDGALPSSNGLINSAARMAMDRYSIRKIMLAGVILRGRLSCDLGLRSIIQIILIFLPSWRSRRWRSGRCLFCPSVRDGLHAGKATPWACGAWCFHRRRHLPLLLQGLNQQLRLADGAPHLQRHSGLS